MPVYYIRSSRAKVLVLLCFLLAACGSGSSAPAASPTPDTSQNPVDVVEGTQAGTPTPVTPLDTSHIDVCKLLPADSVAQVLGHPLVGTPKAFFYSDIKTDSACRYDAGKDAQGNALFAYAVVLPASDYEVSRKNMGITAVTDLGDDAFTQSGTDALQLWALVDGRAGVIVAIGAQENLDGETQLVKLLLSKIT